MKKQLLLIALATLTTGNLFALKHDLKSNGMMAGLKRVYITAENKNDLAPIIKKYYDRVQKGQFDIPFEDLKELYEQLCAINCMGREHQI